MNMLKSEKRKKRSKQKIKKKIKKLSIDKKKRETDLK